MSSHRPFFHKMKAHLPPSYPSYSLRPRSSFHSFLPAIPPDWVVPFPPLCPPSFFLRIDSGWTLRWTRSGAFFGFRFLFLLLEGIILTSVAPRPTGLYFLSRPNVLSVSFPLSLNVAPPDFHQGGGFSILWRLIIKVSVIYRSADFPGSPLLLGPPEDAPFFLHGSSTPEGGLVPHVFGAPANF